MDAIRTDVTFQEYPAVTVNNGELELTIVPALGSNIIAIRHIATGLPLLRTPARREDFAKNTFLNGIPVLFPPNRLEDGVLTFQDRVYHFDMNEPKYHNHIHGLVHDKPWTVVKQERTEQGAVIITELDAANFPEILRQFPHRFVLRMVTELQGSTVRIAMEVSNQSERPMPWGLGYHTTFRFPFAEGGDLSRCTMRLGAKRRWELSDRLLPTGNLLESDDLQQFRSGIDLTERPLDDVFLSTVADGGRNECVLTDPDANLTVTYRADSAFLHWVIYNADSRQGFVCPEPYTWVTNAPNLDMDPSLTGLRVLKPGETTRVVTEIDVAAAK